MFDIGFGSHWFDRKEKEPEPEEPEAPALAVEDVAVPEPKTSYCQKCGAPIKFVNRGAISWWLDGHGATGCGTGKHKPGHQSTGVLRSTGRARSIRAATDEKGRPWRGIDAK